MDRDAEGTLTPRLATDWYVKEGDETVWVFELREGVKFHNGADFTAEDVVFSLDRAKSEGSNMRQLHADVVEIRAVDDHTVEVQMAGPSPLYPNNVTNTFMMDKDWSRKTTSSRCGISAPARTTTPSATPTAPVLCSGRARSGRAVRAAGL